MAQYHESKECCGEKKEPKPTVERRVDKHGMKCWGMRIGEKFAPLGVSDKEQMEEYIKDGKLNWSYDPISMWSPIEEPATKPSIPGLPEGVEVVAYRAPEMGDFFLESAEVIIRSVSVFSTPRLIVTPSAGFEITRDPEKSYILRAVRKPETKKVTLTIESKDLSEFISFCSKAPIVKAYRVND